MGDLAADTRAGGGLAASSRGGPHAPGTGAFAACASGGATPFLSGSMAFPRSKRLAELAPRPEKGAGRLAKSQKRRENKRGCGRRAAASAGRAGCARPEEIVVKSEHARDEDLDSVIVRPYPKVVLLYPLALCALVCGAIQSFAGEPSPERDWALGLVFFTVFGLNLLVFSFEFSRMKTLTIGLGILAAVFLVLWLGERWPIIQYLREFVLRRRIAASTEFYLGLFTYLALIFIGVLVNTRFNYWEIKHNEIVHHTGFLGQVRRFPSPNLKTTLEITDVFEYALLRCGRITLFPASEQRPIVLENVLNVNAVERDIRVLLSSLQVEIEPPRRPR